VEREREKIVVRKAGRYSSEDIHRAQPSRNAAHDRPNHDADLRAVANVEELERKADGHRIRTGTHQHEQPADARAPTRTFWFG
jgi:hypothetical protein